MNYKVVEKFVSINGEGLKSGQLSVFIRFAGCNLNCNYCDTKWANEKDVKYTLMTEKEILSYIKENRSKKRNLNRWRTSSSRWYSRTFKPSIFG